MGLVAFLHKLMNANEGVQVPLEHLTPRAMRVLTLARDEAAKAGQALTIRHLALTLLDFGQGCGPNVLRNCRIDLPTLTKFASAETSATSIDELVKLAWDETKLLNHTYLGTEHLLLAIIRHGENSFARYLATQGIDLVTARQKVLKELDPNFEPDDRE